MLGIELGLSGVKAHSSGRIGEKLHNPHRRIYKKVELQNENIPGTLIPKFSIKSLN